jgi:hypothetical protein
MIDIYTCISFDYINNIIVVNTEAGRLLKLSFIAETIESGIPENFYKKIMN